MRSLSADREARIGEWCTLARNLYPIRKQGSGKDRQMAAVKRFVGLDVHRRSVTVAAVDVQQNIVLPPREISMPRFFT